MTQRWRHGNRQPRNLYVDDQPVGLVDSMAVAEAIVMTMNAAEAAPGKVQVELMGLSVMVTVLDRMTPDERARSLTYLTDRFGKETA